MSVCAWIGIAIAVIFVVTVIANVLDEWGV